MAFFFGVSVLEYYLLYPNKAVKVSNQNSSAITNLKQAIDAAFRYILLCYRISCSVNLQIRQSE